VVKNKKMAGQPNANKPNKVAGNKASITSFMIRATLLLE
jgi:hypothetical protein